MPGYYDLMMAQYGLAAPGDPYATVFNRRTQSHEVAPSFPIAQAAIEHQQMLDNIPDVSYNQGYDATQLRKQLGVQSGGGSSTPAPTQPMQSGMISNPFVQSSPDFSVQQSIAQAAAASNDPDYQNNLARALYASTGLPQEQTYGEQRRQQAISIATGELQDGLKRARSIRSASKDIEAVNAAYRNNSISDAAYEKALGDIQKEYGAGIVANTPEFAQATGTMNQLMDKRRTSMQDFAKLHNAPANHVTWDADADQPTFNNSAVAYDSAMATLRDKQANAASRPTKDAIAAKRAALESTGRQLKVVSDGIAKMQAAKQQVPAAESQTYNRLQRQLFAGEMELQSLLGGQPQSFRPMTEPQPQAAPRLTNVVPAATGKSFTMDQARAALQLGQIDPTKTYYIDGVPGKYNTATRQFERVQ